MRRVILERLPAKRYAPDVKRYLLECGQAGAEDDRGSAFANDCWKCETLWQGDGERAGREDPPGHRGRPWLIGAGILLLCALALLGQGILR